MKATNLFEILTTIQDPLQLVALVALAALGVAGLAIYAILQALKWRR